MFEMKETDLVKIAEKAQKVDNYGLNAGYVLIENTKERCETISRSPLRQNIFIPDKKGKNYVGVIFEQGGFICRYNTTKERFYHES